VTGTLTTAAQPNITSVGTLASLSVTGNANVGNIGATAGIYTTLSASGNASAGNLVLANAAIITVGANTNVGTLTGNFSLSAGSRHAATYS
jgi:hypothetical protein